MAGNRTFSIIKPDAVAKGYIGKIIDDILQAGFQIKAMKLLRMTKEMAAQFYKVHKGKPFYEDLITYMSSGPCVVMVLEKENAVEDFRQLIGNTDPKKAAEGTIRRKYAESIEANAIHGADSDENAQREIRFFFAEIEEV